MIFIRENVKQRIKFSITILVIAIAVAVAIFTVMKYEVEGEKEVPFKVGKIVIISSATTTDNNVNSSAETEQNGENTEQIEEQENVEQQDSEGNGESDNQEITESQESNEPQENSEQLSEDVEQQPVEENYIWQEKVVQTNDVYIYLDKNKEFKEEQIIKSVKIENIKILENVKIGKIQVYMPNSLNDGLYKYVNEYLVNSSLTYIGAENDNKKALEIGNQGGCVYLSFANTGLEEYKSNEDQEIQQGGFLLEKMNLANEDLKFKVSFDLIIEVQDKAYRTNLELDMPIDGVIGQKEAHEEIKEFDSLVFKRQ